MEKRVFLGWIIYQANFLENIYGKLYIDEKKKKKIIDSLSILVGDLGALGRGPRALAHPEVSVLGHAVVRQLGQTDGLGVEDDDRLGGDVVRRFGQLGDALGRRRVKFLRDVDVAERILHMNTRKK